MRKVLFTTVVFLGLLAGLCANDIVPQGTTNNLQTELEPNQEPLDDTVLNPLNRECLNHNAAWNYLWYGEAGVGRASLFLLEAGEYALESVYIADYSNTWVGLTEATATITVATTDADGTTLASIAEATMTTDGSVGEVTWENTTFELAQAGYVKVVVLSTTSAGDVNADGQEDFAPFLLSDDGSDPQGCGTDIDGVYSAGSYNWDIEFCASPTADPLPAVFFSEYAEGSSNNKYLEIYNGTDADVDLTGFAFPNVSNDPTEVGVYEYWNTFPEGATVAPGDVYVIGHGSADEIILAETDFTFTYLSNGDDGFCLVEGTEDSYVIVDCIGDWNGDPGSGWSVAGIENATQNHTLVRKDDVTEGNGGDWASSAGTNEDNSEWIVLDNEVWDYLGWHIDAPFDCDLNDLSLSLIHI